MKKVVHIGMDVGSTTVKIAVMNEKLEVTLSLENNSNYDIEEVVQIYLSIPYYKYLRPIKELIGFEKVKVEICKCRGLCSFYAEKGGLLIGYEKVKA